MPSTAASTSSMPPRSIRSRPSPRPKGAPRRSSAPGLPRGRRGSARTRRRRGKARTIMEAGEASLKRLKTDHIDLYQLHWPDRPMRIFEGLEYLHLEGDGHPVDDILGALGKLVADGKVRFVGFSNETPWEVMSFLKAAEQHGPRPASIQNAYNLVNRSFEIGLSEVAHREEVSLIAIRLSAR